MSSYKKYIIAILLVGFFVSCSFKSQNIEKSEKNYAKVAIKEFEAEDFYIMYALEMENLRLYDSAKELYLKLFLNTSNYEYLKNYASIATQLQEFEAIKEQVSKYLIPNIKEEEVLLRLYSFALLRLNELDEALKNALNLLDKYKNSLNYELLGTILANKDEYLKAHESFNEAIKYEETTYLVLSKTGLEFFRLNRQKEAIEYLKSYLLRSNYEFEAAIQLLAFYKNLDQKENIQKTLKEMFLYYKNSEDAMNLNKTIAIMFQNFEIDEIISFLEQNQIEDDFLLDLYKNTRQTKKAYELLKKLYTNNSNSSYLGQQAIFEFELADEKSSVLASVLEKFDLALETSTNPIFQNYMAYLLIDYDIDIKKGLNLVKKALEQDPTNIAFIDTLAWGEYKIKNCKEAFRLMKTIVDEIGLEDEEIRIHWEKIKECKENDTRKNK